MSLRWKFFLSIAPPSTLILLLFAFWSIGRVESVVIATAESQMRLLSETFVDVQLSRNHDLLTSAGLADVLSHVDAYQTSSYDAMVEIARDHDGDVVVLDAGGAVRFSSTGERPGLLEALTEAAAAGAAGRSTCGRVKTAVGGAQRFCSTYFEPWALRVFYLPPQGRVRAAFDDVRRAALLVSLAMGGLFLLLVWVLLERLVISRLGVLSEGMGRVAAGDLDSRIGRLGGDEVGALARTFDEMTARLGEVTASRAALADEMRARREADEALRVSEARFRAIFEASTDCIFVWSREQRCLFANEAAATYFGVPRERLIGEAMSEALSEHPEFVRLWSERVTRVVETGRALQVGDSGLPIGGQDVVSESAAAPIVGSQGRVDAVGVVYRDITSRKQDEQRLRDTQASMAQVERLSALGTLVGGVAHEINNPLMGIQSYVGFAARRTTDEKARTMLEKALKEVARIGRIVRNMLLFARSRSEDEGTCVLPSTLARALELVKTDTRRSTVEIETDLPAELPPLRASSDAVQQVLLNLLVNACDAVADSEERRVKVSASTDAGMATITVADSGPGIEPQAMNRIFDPFFTTKAVGKGTGLGLSVSRQIVEAMGGTLTARNGATGAVFEVSLRTDEDDMEEGWE